MLERFVIPLFVEQIKNNKPITITDPNMTRYLMTLEDIGLVMHAFSEGISGDIFVQKAPSSSILDLANALSSIFNYDKPHKVIGLVTGRNCMKHYYQEKKWQELKIVGMFLDYRKIQET